MLQLYGNKFIEFKSQVTSAEHDTHDTEDEWKTKELGNW